MKILLVEDDKTISNNSAFYLRKYSYLVDQAFTINQSDELLLSNEYDLLVIDRTLPDGDGVSLVKKCRDIKNNIPIIMITARTLLEDKVEAFEIGVDDYVTKPFQLPELLVRIKSILRRTNLDTTTSLITIGDLEINTDSCSVTIKSKEIELTGKTYNVLEYLAMNKDRIVSRDEICERVLDLDNESSNVVDVHIAYIRKAFGKKTSNKLIKTVKGKGYMLCSK